MAEERTEEVDISGEGQKACNRIETALGALDKAIAIAERKSSPDAKDGAKISAQADQAQKSQTNSAGLTSAQKNSQDHPNHFFLDLAKAAVRFKLTGQLPAIDPDHEIHKKYGEPLEKKLARARELKIGAVEIAGKKVGVGAVAINTKKDIELAKATASLVAEGKSKLEIPVNEVKPADAQRGAKFAEAIIDNAKDLKAGKPLRHAPREKAQAPDPRNVIEAYVQRKEINGSAQLAQAERDGGAKPRESARMGAADYMKAIGIKTNMDVKPGLINDINNIAKKREQQELEERVRREAVEKMKRDEEARLLAQSNAAAAQRKAVNPGAAAAIMAPVMQLTPTMGAAQMAARNNYGFEA